MVRAGIYRSPRETLSDFSTQARPSLFIDNWGVDTASQHPDKVERPINRAIELAQLLTSVQSGQEIRPNELEIGYLNGMTIVDGSDGAHDFFFFVRLDPIFSQGSYSGPRVSFTLLEGSISAENSYLTYEPAWSTLRSHTFEQREPEAFLRDLMRFNNVIRNLEKITVNELVTVRPPNWPGEPNEPSAYNERLTKLPKTHSEGQRQAIFVGNEPIGMTHKPRRQQYIHRLDGPDARPRLEDAEEVVIDALAGRPAAS